MGGKKKYIEMFGSFMEPVNSYPSSETWQPRPLTSNDNSSYICHVFPMH